MSAKLEHCPECGHRWPSGPDYALRGCGWLQGLSRAVSPTNGDVDIHDFHSGGRFLRLEIKSPHEAWPPQKGQLRALIALASSPRWVVRILRGDTRALDYHVVDERGLRSDPIRTHAEAVRRAVDAWLRGALWRDAETFLTPPPERAPDPGHVHGWARVEGVWTCVGDYYAAGHAAQANTACGATLPQFS